MFVTHKRFAVLLFLPSSCVNSILTETKVALGKQIVRNACPRDKLEFNFLRLENLLGLSEFSVYVCSLF